MEDPTGKNDPINKARRETSTAPIEDVSQARDYDPAFKRTGSWPDPEVERAQPGDVLGIEREGEVTGLGDTAEDEDKRRRDAQKKG